MFQAWDECALLRAILQEDCPSDRVAARHLAEAARLAMDPLDYCAHQFGLGNRLVWQRAALWLEMVYAESLPSSPELPLPRIDHLDRLGEMRSCRCAVVGGEAIFIAPNFAQVRRLKSARPWQPSHPVRITTPEAIEAALVRGASEQLMENARGGMTVRWPDASAAVSVPLAARIGFVIVLALLVLLAMMAGVAGREVLIPLAAMLLLAPGLLRLAAAWPISPPLPPAPLADAELPSYTVLVPLRDETQMVPGLVRALSAIDYPPHKLDIKFVVENRSPETVRAVEQALHDPRFRLIVVPPGRPQTKPKALDYALPLARGELLVVYDAEDVPAPDQLRLAAARFSTDPDLACLQAELIPENAAENTLTSLFAIEYAGLFVRLLPALARWRLPMPLGGTSNHFRTALLREVGGWDAFNVTEDADLGVRLARRRLRVETLESQTLEEAPLTLSAWMGQRTRWMKGWMQTYIVHSRHPIRLLRDLGWRGFLGFQVLVSGMILSAILHTIFVGSMLGRLVVEGLEGFAARDAWDWFSIAILTAGYGGALAMGTSGLLRQKALHLLPLQVLLPAYWFLHSIAALLAAIELIRKPMHWAKTTHGLTRVTRGQRVAGLPASLSRPSVRGSG